MAASAFGKPFDIGAALSLLARFDRPDDFPLIIQLATQCDAQAMRLHRRQFEKEC